MLLYTIGSTYWKTFTAPDYTEILIYLADDNSGTL